MMSLTVSPVIGRDYQGYASGIYQKCVRFVLVITGITGCMLVSAMRLGAQNTSPQSGVRNSNKLSPPRLRDLLRSPGGLAKCAELVGNCIIEKEQNLFARVNLRTLTEYSSLIVTGAIENQRSELDNEWNTISTRYTVRPENIIKGAASGNITLTVQGGRYEFSNGTAAEIATTEWKQLKIGQRYTFFLKQNPANEYIPTNGVEALFRLSTKDGTAEVLASRETGTGPHPIIEEVKGLAPGALTAKVQTILSRSGAASQR